MQEDTKISDLTVAEFRTLMQQCFESEERRIYVKTWGASIQARQAAQENLRRYGPQVDRN